MVNGEMIGDVRSIQMRMVYIWIGLAIVRSEYARGRYTAMEYPSVTGYCYSTDLYLTYLPRLGLDC